MSVVDVAIGRVSILALSIDSSVVSAVVGGEIHCFLVELLLKKVIFLPHALGTCGEFENGLLDLVV